MGRFFPHALFQQETGKEGVGKGRKNWHNESL